MELEDLIRTVQKFEMLNKSFSKQKLTGLQSSILKGRGLTFDSIRKYETGDEVRNINRNVTAGFSGQKYAIRSILKLR